MLDYLAQQGTIYAIGVPGQKLVKIGRTAGSARQRLATLQIGQPFTLQVLAEVTVQTHVTRIEKAIHGFLAPEHQRGEWFAVVMDQPHLEALVARAAQSLGCDQASSSLTPACIPDAVGWRVKQVLLVHHRWTRVNEALATDIVTGCREGAQMSGGKPLLALCLALDMVFRWLEGRYQHDALSSEDPMEDPRDVRVSAEIEAALEEHEARLAAMTDEEFFAYLVDDKTEGVVGWDA